MEWTRGLATVILLVLIGTKLCLGNEEPTSTTEKPSSSAQPTTEPKPFVYEAPVCTVNNSTYLKRALLPSDCGSPVPEEGTAKFNLADLNEHPWMAIIRYNDTFDGYKNITRKIGRCEGTLINKRYVLTAAQCTEKQPVDVVLGKYRTSDDCVKSKIGNRQFCAEYAIECIRQHVNYNATLETNDIALIRLAKDVDFKIGYIKPICLPSSNLKDFKPINSNRYIMSSWAMWQETLRETTVLNVNRINCTSFPTIKKDNEMERTDFFCAELKNNLNDCFVHSGAPLGMNAKHGQEWKFIQYGIVSFKKPCIGSYPFLYTKVENHIKWILENLMA